MEKGNKAILPICYNDLWGSPNDQGKHGRNLRNVRIRHASLHRSVIRMDHLGKAQEDEGGRELGSLRN